MSSVADLLFQSNLLKALPRSGYHFLGSGKESVAEHSFSTAFIGWVITQIRDDIDPLRLISMCLVHDLVEARTGDLNHLQKAYVTADTAAALADTVDGIPFGPKLADLVDEFDQDRSPEANLAHDADQLSLILELKCLVDRGFRGPETWIPRVVERLSTSTGKQLAKEVLATEKDHWWLENVIDTPRRND